MRELRSYVQGELVAGSGGAQTLVNPTTEAPIATTSTGGIDMGAALTYARAHGGPALRALSFKERGALLDGVAKVLHAHREELFDLAVENGGNTRSDAKFDVDGAWSTLAHYAKLGESLGDACILADGEPAQLGKSPRLVGKHYFVPLRGAAVLINAFNFPAWGFAEKAAVAWLAGMPVITKPATSTAVVAARMVELIAEGKLLPAGALTFLAGGVGDLVDRLGPQDVLAFTGSSHTGAMLRGKPNLVSGNVRVNIEADSLNAAILGQDVTSDSDTYALFLREVTRDMTQKAGQKCTAIRRIFVPKERLAEVGRDLAEALAQVKVGDPALKEVGMGPLATAQQLADVKAGVERLAAAGRKVFGDGGRGKLVGVEGKGFFLSPVLFASDDAAAKVVHEHEVFGPVATLLPYDGSAAQVAPLVALGGGGLVSSIYSDDDAFVRRAVLELAPYHGRLHLGSAKVAEHSPGPGTVMPQLVHGGPGRAGGGEELGGVRSLRFYMQRTAVQGYAPLVEKLATP